MGLRPAPALGVASRLLPPRGKRRARCGALPQWASYGGPTVAGESVAGVCHASSSPGGGLLGAVGCGSGRGSRPPPRAGGRHGAKPGSPPAGCPLILCYKYRLYPSPAQEHVLGRYLAACSAVYNAALQQRSEAYQRVTLDHVKDAPAVPANATAQQKKAALDAAAAADRRVALAWESYFGGGAEGATELFAALLERSKRYPRGPKRKGQSVSRYEQSRQLTEARDANEADHALGVRVARRNLIGIDEIPRAILTDVLIRLERAFAAFYRRCEAGETPGYPRFQRRGDYRSLGCQYAHGVRLKEDGLHLAGVPGAIRIVLHRPVGGVPKHAVITREAGDWNVVLQCDEVSAPIVPPSAVEVGVDLGINVFAVLDDGTEIQNPKYLDRYLRTPPPAAGVRRDIAPLVRAQQSDSRKIEAAKQRPRGAPKSKRLARAKLRVAKLHARVARQRLDFHHKTARDLVRGAGKIAIEAISVADMVPRTAQREDVRDPKTLNRRVLDAAPSQFRALVKAKGEAAGRVVVEVPARRGQKDHGTVESARRILAEAQANAWAPPTHKKSPPASAAETAAGSAVAGRASKRRVPGPGGSKIEVVRPPGPEGIASTVGDSPDACAPVEASTRQPPHAPPRLKTE